MIVLQKNGIEKKVSTGYSWKSLFFGVFYPAARGDLKGFMIQLGIAFFTSGISWFFVPFTYNKIYLDRLVSDGWELKP
jgi:hypothetical protein